jgi:hypothetical protein
MTDEEFMKQKLAEGVNGVKHFMCSECGEIVEAYSLGIGFKPILKGKCKACSKEAMRKKKERYPDCEHWMHIIDDPALLKKMREETIINHGYAVFEDRVEYYSDEEIAKLKKEIGERTK